MNVLTSSQLHQCGGLDPGKLCPWWQM